MWRSPKDVQFWRQTRRSPTDWQEHAAASAFRDPGGKPINGHGSVSSLATSRGRQTCSKSQAEVKDEGLGARRAPQINLPNDSRHSSQRINGLRTDLPSNAAANAFRDRGVSTTDGDGSVESPNTSRGGPLWFRLRDPENARDHGVRGVPGEIFLKGSIRIGQGVSVED